jgi:hypothetical protein
LLDEAECWIEGSWLEHCEGVKKDVAPAPLQFLFTFKCI